MYAAIGMGNRTPDNNTTNPGPISKKEAAKTILECQSKDDKIAIYRYKIVMP